MSETPTPEEIAPTIGAKASEIDGLEETDHGLVIRFTKSAPLILVPEDRPDAGGKTGLMLLERPVPRYKGTFPVFKTPIGEEAPAGVDLTPGEYPTSGTVADVLGWVAGDLDRAKEALSNETSQDKPRSSLLNELEAIVNQWDEKGSTTADELLSEEEQREAGEKAAADADQGEAQL